MRESPSLKLTELLKKHEAQVDYHDPYIPLMPQTRRYQWDMRSVPLTSENLASYDAVLIATDHSCLDYDSIATNAAFIVDTRNAINSKNHHPKIIKA